MESLVTLIGNQRSKVEMEMKSALSLILCSHLHGHSESPLVHVETRGIESPDEAAAQTPVWKLTGSVKDCQSTTWTR